MEAALAKDQGGENPVETLSAWFPLHEQRLTLTEVGRSEARTVLRLAATTQGEGANSGAHFLVRKNRAETRILPLAYRDAFDLAHGAGVTGGLADVTGDGKDELIAIHAHRPGGNDAFYYADLLVYEVATDPPRLLPFWPSPATRLGGGEADGWTVLEEAGKPRLRVRESPSEQCDVVSIVRTYTWTGERLQLAESGYEIGASAGNRFCLPFVFAAAEDGQKAALEYLEDNVYSGGPEQADALRYRLGIYHALGGNSDAATGYLNDLIARPLGSERAWVRMATRFLDRYEMPAGLFPACRDSDYCDTKQALRLLVGLQPTVSYALTARQLRTWNVPVTRWSFFDMDGDGALEQWMLIDAGSTFELWILIPGNDTVKALFVDTIAGNAYAAAMERITSVAGAPIVRLDNGQERLLFTFSGTPSDSNSPAVTSLRSQSANESDNYTAELLTRSQAALWQGTDGASIADTLNRFRQSRDFNCTLGPPGSICAEYVYTLALARELSGNESAAIELYLDLWRRFPDTPYATMARVRIVQSTVSPTALPRTDTPTP